MKSRLTATKENRDFLTKAFGCSERTVFRALANVSNSPLSKKIRKVAKERGSFEVVESNAVETFHDADNVMRQYLPNGALLELDKLTGSVTVWFDGIKVKSYQDVKLSEISHIQTYAMELK